MPRLKLYVIPEPRPNTASVLDSTEAPNIRGDYGDWTYECGACGIVLIQSINEGQVVDMVIRCPVCRAFNQIEKPDQPTRPEPVN